MPLEAPVMSAVSVTMKRLGLHHHFHAVVFFFIEDFVGMRRLCQRQAVSNDVVQSNLSLFDPL